MKTLIIILIWLAATAVFAATLTIDIPNADIPRMTEAYGSIYNLGRPATQAEIENAVRRWLRDSTQDYERRKNQAQFTPPPMEITPAPTPAPTPTAFGPAAAAKAAATATPKQKKR